MCEKLITGHTVHRYDEELLAIHGSLLRMGSDVIAQVKHALAALADRDLDTARAVIARDKNIDALEKEIDEELIKIIARRAPVARDLRLLMAVSKAVTDLERMGDKAVKIAGQCLRFYENGVGMDLNGSLMAELDVFGKIALGVLEEVIGAFAEFSLTRAEGVLRNITTTEMEFQSGLRRLINLVLEDGRNLSASLGVVFIIKCLDRIVDHSENIAEHLVFLIRGEDIRHTEG